MLKAESLIAAGLMALSAYFMWYATALPIGWNGVTGGPGGGAFPFWLSLVMLLVSGATLVKSITGPAPEKPFFDPDMVRPVASVIVALAVTIGLMHFVGSYIALPLFMFWYLRIKSGHGWVLTLILTLTTPVFLFFFFEVTLKILLPKGWTEPWFYPLYAMFF